MKWSREQLDAIYKKGCNIIVSAGAGSGKTAVLTQRIYENIKNTKDVNSLLVLTFTNAAAREMKQRVLKKISSDVELNYLVADVLASNITTFDAYSYSLVKKYYYALDISPNIKIADSLYISSVRRNLLDQILDEEYESGDISNFFKFFKRKNDDLLKQIVISITYDLELEVDTYSYINNYIDNYYCDTTKTKILNEYSNQVKIQYQSILDLMVELKGYSENEKLINYIDDFTFNNDELSLYDDIFSAVNSISLPRLKDASDNEKACRDELGKVIKEIKSQYLIYDSYLELDSEFMSNKEVVSYITCLVLKLYNKLSLFKKENDYYEFNDIAKLAISLVRDNNDILMEIKNSLYEILIDEYQDTSDLQEAFLSYIVNDNLYMVGDIKQSIYRFRNANPYIFKEKYDNYSKGIGGYKIDLNQNFRSRKEVLDNINLIFEDIMSDEFGDANYKESHKMNFGLTSYESNKMNINYNMQILKYSNDDTDYKDNEVEAFIIADDILNKVNNYMIYNKETNVLDKATYKDFCIILDRNTNFDLFKKIFEYKGIPLSIVADQTLNESVISSLVFNVLNMIVNCYLKQLDRSFYHSFTSIARSFIFNLSDNEIYKIVSSKNLDNEIYKTVKEASLLVNVYSCSDILNKVIEEFDLTNKICRIGSVKQNLIELEYILSLCDSLENVGKGIKEIRDILKDMLNSDTAIKYNMSNDIDNSVKIMNIHKSKGLEFPICYFSMLGVSYNQADYKSKFGYFKQSGIYTPNINTLNDMACKVVGKNITKKEDISEKIRLFYVALTRVREQIIIVSPSVSKVRSMRDNNNMNAFLYYIKNKIGSFTTSVDFSNLVCKDYLIKKKVSQIKDGSYKLSYNNNVVETTEIISDKISKSILNIIDEKQDEFINMGLLMHEALQAIDFKNPNAYSLNTTSQVQDSVCGVLSLDLFKNIASAKVFKEHEFMCIIDNKQYHGIIDLLVMYDTHIDIIDYKLFNLNHDEYIRQLSIYASYVRMHTDKLVNCYLMSVLSLEVRKVEV